MARTQTRGDVGHIRAQETFGDPVAASIAVSWRELRRGAAMQQARRRFYEGHAVELDMGQADTLGLLVADGAVRMRDLAEALRVDRSTATRAADRLVRLGLAERVAASEDGRGVVLEATPEGVALWEDVVGRYRAFLLEVLDGFAPKERATLAALLERFIDRIDEVLAATPEPA